MNNPSFTSYFFAFFVSMLPVAELRGGLPLAISLGMSPFRAYVVSIAGNTVPVLPLLIGLKYLSKIARKYRWSSRVFSRVERAVQTKKRIVNRYGIGGVILLVAIPLPVTGAWTGSLVSSLLFIPVKYSFPAIFAGICIAGVIVLFATFGVFSIGRAFGGM